MGRVLHAEMTPRAMQHLKDQWRIVTSLIGIICPHIDCCNRPHPWPDRPTDHANIMTDICSRRPVNHFSASFSLSSRRGSSSLAWPHDITLALFNACVYRRQRYNYALIAQLVRDGSDRWCVAHSCLQRSVIVVSSLDSCACTANNISRTV